MSAERFPQLELGRRNPRYVPCACCQRKIRVGMGVAQVICGQCAKRGIGDLLAAKKKARGA